jgi:hypothetical protein
MSISSQFQLEYVPYLRILSVVLLQCDPNVYVMNVRNFDVPFAKATLAQLAFTEALGHCL